MRAVAFLLPIAFAIYGLPAFGQKLLQEAEVEYTLEYSRLGASPISLSGAKIRDERIETFASTAGFSVLMARSVPVRLRIEVYSTDSLLPTDFGSLEAGFASDSLSVLFGIPRKWLPLLNLKRTRFHGQGIITSKFPPFQRNGVALQPGDTFSLGATTDSLLLSWQWGNEWEGNFYASNALGLVVFEYLGATEDTSGEFRDPTLVEQTQRGNGFIGETEFGFSGRLWGSFHGFLGIDNSLILAFPGVQNKVGFKLGVTFNNDHGRLLFYYGAYYWSLDNLSSDFSFRAAETDFGQSIGFTLSRRWKP